MIAARTSASSGLTTSSRSVSVFDGAICSSGTSSPVAGRLYWMRLWWVSSGSSSIRMPVWRSISIAAQVQNARPPRRSGRGASRWRGPAAQMLRPLIGWWHDGPAQCPAGVGDEPPGAVCRRRRAGGGGGGRARWPCGRARAGPGAVPGCADPSGTCGTGAPSAAGPRRR